MTNNTKLIKPVYPLSEREMYQHEIRNTIRQMNELLELCQKKINGTQKNDNKH